MNINRTIDNKNHGKAGKKYHFYAHRNFNAINKTSYIFCNCCFKRDISISPRVIYWSALMFPLSRKMPAQATIKHIIQQLVSTARDKAPPWKCGCQPQPYHLWPPSSLFASRKTLPLLLSSLHLTLASSRVDRIKIAMLRRFIPMQRSCQNVA